MRFLSIFLSFALSSFAAHAERIVLDFEAPLPGSLAPMSYWQGTSVPANARITDEYANLGIVASDVALIQLGSPHTVSGLNGLGPIKSDGTL